MKNFLVSDLKVIDSPQAGIGVARCLNDLGHNVYGLDNTPLVTTSSIFKKIFTVEEMQTLNLDSLVRKIRSIKENYDIDYLIPCYDETVILFSFLKDKMDYLGIELLAPSIEVLKKIRKTQLERLKTVTIPPQQRVSSVEEAQKFAQKIGYPVYVKGLTKAAIRAEDDDALGAAIKKVAGIWNGGEVDCLIQKSIKGKLHNVLLAIRGGRIVSYLEMEKVAIDGNGATWFGKMTTSKDKFDLMQKVVSEIGFQDAIIEVEGIIEEETDKYYIYEINSRPPAWIYAASLNGQNFFETYLNPGKEVVFNNKEAYFGRETLHFISNAKDLSGYSNLQMFSKGAAYKTENQKYPSDILL